MSYLENRVKFEDISIKDNKEICDMVKSIIDKRPSGITISSISESKLLHPTDVFESVENEIVLTFNSVKIIINVEFIDYIILDTRDIDKLYFKIRTNFEDDKNEQIV